MVNHRLMGCVIENGATLITSIWKKEKEILLFESLLNKIYIEIKHKWQKNFLRTKLTSPQERLPLKSPALLGFKSKKFLKIPVVGWKGESQNGRFKKTKQVKFFVFRKIWCAFFLERPVLRFEAEPGQCN